jgi:hypothetical protein
MVFIYKTLTWAMISDILWRSALLTASVFSIRSLFFQCLHHRLPQLAAL